MSLRARFLCLVLLVALLPALLLGWRFLRENNAEIASAVRNLGTTANDVASDLEQRIQGTAQLHYGLAHSRLLDDTDRGPCSAYLSAVREAYPQYTGILTVLPNGQLHCDSLQSGRVLNLTDRGYFQRALAADSRLVTEPVFGRLTGNSVLQVVYPARTDSGRLRFMLVASLNLQRYAENAQRRAQQSASELLLLDDKGVVMAWAGRAKDDAAPGKSLLGTPLHALANTGKTAEIVGHDGIVHVWAVADSPAMRAAGLRVLVGQPRHELVAASTLRLRQGLIVLCGAALLLFAGVWSLAERGIRRPVVRIISMVRDLGAGQLDARIALPHPRGELGSLMSVLNSTADSLQHQRAAIDELTHRLRDAHRREIEERQTTEGRLTHMATYDGLTGLPNRTLLRDRLQQALHRSRRSSRPLALMFLDIDRFKHINDSLGHDVGDRLLVAVARVLQACLRDGDSVAREGRPGPEDEVFRLGGDEFMVLVEDVTSADAVARIAQRILHVLSQPFIVGEHELFISASIGITQNSHPDVELDGLIKQADLAMYRSKDLGRDTYCFFDEKMNLAAAERHRLEVRLRHALERGEYRLHYQPKADMRTGRVTGVEALLRWAPEGEAMVSSDRFIAVLEETGLIVPVGAWVFQQACRQMAVWQRQGLPPLSLAVNVSARQFRHPDLAAQIAAVLDETGLEPGRLQIELTESILIDESEMVSRTMNGLAEMGLGIAIDDFGTGQSSLRYLKRFRVDTLKIDRSFVKDTPASGEDCAIAMAVIALGHGLGLTVVAEGVETPEQLEFLRSRGCDQMQGYLLSRPVDPEAFVAWLDRQEAVQAVA